MRIRLSELSLKWLCLCAVAAISIARAEDPPAESQPATGLPPRYEDAVAWKKGPTTGELGSMAKIDVPAGFRFAGPSDTRTIMEMMENEPTNTELGMIGPDNLDWFVVFEFSNEGYIKDDDRDSLDADALLKTMQESQKQANVERKKRGWAPYEVLGWAKPPGYDPKTNNLTWAINLGGDGGISINQDTRLLGRHGAMRVTLVTGVDDYQKVIPDYERVLKTFAYTSGNRYADFRSGDKLAGYGLGALVAGGAAAVALKTGLLQKFGKLIVVAVIAVGVALKKAFDFVLGRRKADAN